jgi:hypothetical protein
MLTTLTFLAIATPITASLIALMLVSFLVMLGLIFNHFPN